MKDMIGQTFKEPKLEIVNDMIGSPKQWLFKSEEGLILKDMIGRLNKRKDTIGQAIT